MRRNRLGFTLIEIVVVLIVLAVVASIAVPRAIKVSPSQRVDREARSLMRDLEQLRMRSISTKRSIKVQFYPLEGFYSAFLDQTPDRSAVFGETAEEVRASGLLTSGSKGAIPGVALPQEVKFGVGTATTSPLGGPIGGAIDFADDYVEFDTHGMVVPEGTGGVIYLVHQDDASAVSAVTVSGASAFMTWRWVDNTWVR